MRIVIGDKNLSSWSLRPWLALKRTGVPFEETLIRLNREDTHEEILKHSPSGMVPALKIDEGETLWDTLAICEWLAEHSPRPSCGRPTRPPGRWRAAPPPRCTPASPRCAASAR